MERLLAIDSGLTVTKAVIFDLAGRELGVARRNVAQLMPAPRHVERDMAGFWAQTASAIREVLAATQTDPAQIAAIGATAHGDGLYLLDRAGAPLGAGILSLDSRAHGIVAEWQRAGLFAESLRITGQVPHASAPSALLAWIRRHQPERYARIGNVIGCKDWLRACLTGTIGTDRTEASTAFTELASQSYSAEALALFGLADLRPALPTISLPGEVVGHVTDQAAVLTGLRAGTPVCAGLHDVTASALGVGAHRPGVVAVVAGTYSINECVIDTPRTDPRWFCRAAIAPERWNAMSISPASSTNYEWFLDNFCVAERRMAEAEGGSIHAILGPEIEAALRRPSSVLYHPYLFGSPRGAAPSAGFLGLRGWHERGDVLAALLEGVAFNHKEHVAALACGFTVEQACLTGGVSRNPVVAQMFADILDLPVIQRATDEAAAWGAALCAGAAVGAFAAPDADPRDLDAISTRYDPAPDRAAQYAARFAAYCRVAERMADTWAELEDLAQLERGGADD